MKPTTSLVHDRKNEWMQFQDQHFDSLMSSTESPIEALFLATFLTSEWAEGDFTRRTGDRFAKLGGITQYSSRAQNFNGEALFIQPSVLIDGKLYRLDFALVPESFTMAGPTGSPISFPKIAIELDGHEFHEKTKEQASKDKARDRTLQGAGWVVLRFSGSDVYRDAYECLDQVHSVMLREV